VTGERTPSRNGGLPSQRLKGYQTQHPSAGAKPTVPDEGSHVIVELEHSPRV
jgi:hypothetical protein